MINTLKKIITTFLFLEDTEYQSKEETIQIFENELNNDKNNDDEKIVQVDPNNSWKNNIIILAVLCVCMFSIYYFLSPGSNDGSIHMTTDGLVPPPTLDCIRKTVSHFLHEARPQSIAEYYNYFNFDDLKRLTYKLIETEDHHEKQEIMKRLEIITKRLNYILSLPQSRATYDEKVKLYKYVNCYLIVYLKKVFNLD